MLIQILSETKKKLKNRFIFPLFTMSDLHFLIKASGLCSGIKGLKLFEYEGVKIEPKFDCAYHATCLEF